MSNTMSRDPNVTWVQQQVAKRRVKRDFRFFDQPLINQRNQHYAAGVMGSAPPFLHQRRVDPHSFDYRLNQHDRIFETNELGHSYRKHYGAPNDPYW
jgi:hypothetical protein